jgi:hypothetical protein
MSVDVASRLCALACDPDSAHTTSLTRRFAFQFGQELLSTFGTQIGEIALVPATGGLFSVELVSCHVGRRQLGGLETDLCACGRRMKRLLRLGPVEWERRSRGLRLGRCWFGIGRQRGGSLVCIFFFFCAIRESFRCAGLAEEMCMEMEVCGVEQR